MTAIEIDQGLAERARANLARAWPQANVVAADGFAFLAEEPVDAIVVNAGVSHLAPPWLDSLKADNGRLLVPLTSANLWGAFLIITRRGSRYPVRFASRTGIIPCVGGRNPDAEARLTAALARADYTAVKSLRRPPEEPDDTCWLEGEGWWLSTAEAEEWGRKGAFVRRHCVRSKAVQGRGRRHDLGRAGRPVRPAGRRDDIILSSSGISGPAGCRNRTCRLRVKPWKTICDARVHKRAELRRMRRRSFHRSTNPVAKPDIRVAALAA